jgi:hypothetical protein
LVDERQFLVSGRKERVQYTILSMRMHANMNCEP